MKTYIRSLEPLESRIVPAILYALTTTNTLLVFDSETPGTIDATITITGLAGGDSMRGIDFRPATGELYGITVPQGSVANAIVKTYSIDVTTGAATLIGQTAAGVPSAGDIATGFDFNPTVDRMRFVNSSQENARLNPNNGALAGDDTDLTYTGPTVGPIIAAAYDRNFVHSGANFTTLYGIDRGGNRLVVQGGIDGSAVGGPNAGVISSVGSLGITLSGSRDGGMDIENSSGIAFAALTDTGDNLTSLYTIDLTTGAATEIGVIGNGSAHIRSISVPTPTVTVRNATTATYLDPDGDSVTIKITKGDLNNASFALNSAANGGGQLRFIDFNSLTEFQNTNLTILVKKGVNGNGLADIGMILAIGLDLGVVNVKGDLGSIDAGDATTSTPAIKSLIVQSVGRYALDTGATDLNSTLIGGLGALVVKSDFGGFLNITGGTDGNLGSLTIGGSLQGSATDNTGRIVVSGKIGAVKILGSLIPGTGANSARLQATGPILSLTIGGSIFGGEDNVAGRIDAGKIGTFKLGQDLLGVVQSLGDLGPASIGGSIIGGDGNFAGVLTVGGNIASLKVAGSVVGGSGFGSGTINFSNGTKHGAITIGGDLTGQSNSGFIQGSGKTASITIKGSVIGGNSGSGNISSSGEIGLLKIGRNLVGGSIATGDASVSDSGKIEVKRILNVFIGGSIIAGLDESAVGDLTRNATIRVSDDLGAVTIRGSVIGRTGSGGTTLATISARGQAIVASDAKTDIAIKSLTIFGSVELANILAGYDTGLFAANGDAQIGNVTIGGNWITSNLVAGVQDDADAAVDAFFGDADDQAATGTSATIVSRIGAILIKGAVVGTQGTLDSFGFVAQQIASFRATGVRATLTASTDTPFRVFLNSNDVVVREAA